MLRTFPGKAGLVALVCLTLGACASMQGFVAPELSLVNLRWKDATVFESTIDFEVRLTNENPETVVVDGGVLSLYLDGHRIGKGYTSETFEIKRLESVTQKFTMHVDHLSVIQRIRSIHLNKRADYALKGKVHVRRGSGTRRVKVAQVGTLDMRDFTGEPDNVVEESSTD